MNDVLFGQKCCSFFLILLNLSRGGHILVFMFVFRAKEMISISRQYFLSALLHCKMQFTVINIRSQLFCVFHYHTQITESKASSSGCQ